jgi:hypothetical protein
MEVRMISDRWSNEIASEGGALLCVACQAVEDGEGVDISDIAFGLVGRGRTG